jgi:glycosyltransferase involved in cell wall biosynthesis
MRILYVAIDQKVPGITGGSTHVQSVAESLDRLGHEVHVATTPGSAGFPRSGVQWHDVHTPLGRPHFRLARVRALRRLARRVRPDAIIERYHNFGGEGLLAARAFGAAAALEVNAPVVDYRGSRKRLVDALTLVQPMRRWREWQCRTADLIVTPTPEILPRSVAPSKILQTEWGVDTSRFAPRIAGVPPFRRRDEDEIIVVFAGAFRAWHGIDHLVDAMVQLSVHARPGHPRFRTILIGDGPERKRIARRIARSGLDAITLTGPIPHADMPAALAAADIGAAPFDVEAHRPLAHTFFWSPLKIFEYMASGLPVVAPDLPRLRAIVGADEGGVLYDPKNPVGLARALERLADADLRGALAQGARHRAVSLFSWDTHARRLVDALEAVGAER